jgi:hypothetical protein
MPEPQWHLASAPLVYALFRKLGLPGVEAMTAALASVLIDADHLCDIAYYRATKNRLCQLIPLHSWELVAVLLLSDSRRARSIGAGFLVHHLLDWTVGDYPFRKLSFLYRLSKGFKTEWLGDWVLWPTGPRGLREILHSDTQG